MNTCLKTAALPLILALASVASVAGAQAATAPGKQFIKIQLDASANQATNGRLLVFARDAKSAESEAFEKSKQNPVK